MSLCSSLLGCDPENQQIYACDQELVYNICGDCGIIWRSENSFHLEKTYDQSYIDSKGYEKNRAHKVVKSGWLLDMARSIKPDISSVLEVGCSLGNTLEAAAFRDMEHLGIDVSEIAVKYCQSRGLNATLQSLQELVVAKHEFQLIFMQHVLEHFKDPFQVLKQCHRLLTTGGLLVILIPNSDYRRSQRLRERHKFYNKSGVGLEHYVYFNYNNLKQVLEQCGYSVVQANYPLNILKADGIKHYLNRVARRTLTLLKMDQELVVVAEKR